MGLAEGLGKRGAGMSKRPLHECDEHCACPVHGTPMIYWPAGDDHACQDVTCKHGHGGWNPADGFFISPLREPLTDGEVREAWRGSPRPRKRPSVSAEPA